MITFFATLGGYPEEELITFKAVEDHRVWIQYSTQVLQCPLMNLNGLFFILFFLLFSVFNFYRSYLYIKYGTKNNHFDVCQMTLIQRVPTTPKRRHAVCCGNTVVFISLCVLVERTEENVHTHVSVVQREGPGSVLFSTDGSQEGEGGVCMCVVGLGVCWSVFFLCLSTIELPLHPCCFLDVSQVDRTHPSVYTFTLSFSVFLLPLSICSSITPSHLCPSLFFPLHHFTFSV